LDRYTLDYVEALFAEVAEQLHDHQIFKEQKMFLEGLRCFKQNQNLRLLTQSHEFRRQIEEGSTRPANRKANA
jgi:hypothetical protein